MTWGFSTHTQLLRRIISMKLLVFCLFLTKNIKILENSDFKRCAKHPFAGQNRQRMWQLFLQKTHRVMVLSHHHREELAELVQFQVKQVYKGQFNEIL